MKFQPTPPSSWPPSCFEGPGDFRAEHVRSLVHPVELSSNQVSRLMRFAQETHGSTEGSRRGKWARLTYRELACAIEIVRITLGKTPPGDDLRIQYDEFENLFRLLRGLGFTLPLLQARIDYANSRDLVMRVVDEDQASTMSGQILLFAEFRTGSDFMRHIYFSKLPSQISDRLIEEYRRAKPPNYGTFIERYSND